MKRRLGRVASHDVTKRLEKLDARPLEGHFAMRLPGKDWRGILEVDGKLATQRLFSAILSQPAGTYFRARKKSDIVRRALSRLSDSERCAAFKHSGAPRECDTVML